MKNILNKCFYEPSAEIFTLLKFPSSRIKSGQNIRDSEMLHGGENPVFDVLKVAVALSDYVTYFRPLLKLMVVISPFTCTPPLPRSLIRHSKADTATGQKMFILLS